MSDERYLGGAGGQRGELLGALAALIDVGGLRRAHEQLADQVDRLTRRLDGEDTTQLREAVADLAGRVQGLDDIAAAVAALAEQVDALAGAGGPAELAPVDVAHVPTDQLTQWTAELTGWVRDVLAPGWPHAAAQLPACWPQHPDLLNAVAWLRCAYTTAYVSPGGRAHHAADWWRWLHEVTETAAQVGHDCRTAGAAHPWPPTNRDDTAAGAAAARRTAVGRAVTAARQAADPSATAAAKDAAAEVFQRLGVTRAEWDAAAGTTTSEGEHHA